MGKHASRFGYFVVSISRRSLIGLISLYRFLLSPWVGQHCRFTPSCSQYAIEAIEKYGCWKGSLKAALRIARCHPWGKGGYDPVI